MSTRDEIWIEKLKRGDRGAQRELYDRHSSPLLAIAMRYLGNREAAEDALHDALIKIFGAVGSFDYRGEGSLRAWMSRIVVNTSLEQLRRRKPERVASVDLAGLSDEQLAAEDDPPRGDSIPTEQLLQFVAELPEGYRTVFNLFCVEGYSHREIAQRLGINEKSSSSQLLRAKRLLATKIKSYIEQHG